MAATIDALSGITVGVYVWQRMMKADAENAVCLEVEKSMYNTRNRYE